MIRKYLRNQENVDEKLEQIKLWRCVANVEATETNRGRVSDPGKPIQAAHNPKLPALLEAIYSSDLAICHLINVESPLQL